MHTEHGKQGDEGHERRRPCSDQRGWSHPCDGRVRGGGAASPDGGRGRGRRRPQDGLEERLAVPDPLADLLVIATFGALLLELLWPARVFEVAAGAAVDAPNAAAPMSRPTIRPPQPRSRSYSCRCQEIAVLFMSAPSLGADVSPARHYLSAEDHSPRADGNVPAGQRVREVTLAVVRRLATQAEPDRPAPRQRLLCHARARC